VRVEYKNFHIQIFFLDPEKESSNIFNQGFIYFVSVDMCILE